MLGPIEWTNEVSGYCKCPGIAFHTTKNSKRDCRVHLDGSVNLLCFHSQCSNAVRTAGKALWKALQPGWAILLLNGKTLRNGDVLPNNGIVITREEIKASAIANGQLADERGLIESIKVAAERYKADLFEHFRWPFNDIVNSSPLQVRDREPEDQFRTWLRIWPMHCHLWTGDVTNSGHPNCAKYFRPIAEWYQIGQPLGNFTTGASFKPGSYQRNKESMNGHRFMVIESDSLSKDQVGALAAYLVRRLNYRLYCVVDTAGKSLHFWLNAPRHTVQESRLKAALEVLGADPKVFTWSQPCRVPGSFRDGVRNRLQRLVWLKQ